MRLKRKFKAANVRLLLEGEIILETDYQWCLKPHTPKEVREMLRADIRCENLGGGKVDRNGRIKGCNYIFRKICD